MATEGKTEKDSEIIQKARDCLDRYLDRESDNIRRAEEAIRFRAGEQWPQAIKQDRENPNQAGGARPCPVLDKTNQYIRQIVNEERMTRAAIRIRPVDDDADPKVAEVLTGIIRHIEDVSQAIEAYTSAGENAIDGGFGYWRILTEYSDPLSFDQEILIKRVPNRFSVAMGYHMESDGADSREVVIWEDISEELFKSQYPKAKLDGFDAADDWRSKDTIRVAEYMYIDTKPIKLHLLADGRVVTDDELGNEKPLKSRTEMEKTVKWKKITGAEVLEGTDMLGNYIPVIKVTGSELFMPDGKSRLSGAIEEAMDPQRLHNFAHAGFIENVALAPRAPWLAEEGQIAGYEDEYSVANRKNIALLKYKSVSDELGHPLPIPQRLPPPGIPVGWDRMLQNTEHGIEASFGMYGPSVGATSQEKSGVALKEQKAQGMVGNFHFPDNLARSIQHTGRILVDWIPKVYNTDRIARMLGEDGDQEMVYLNPDQEQAVVPRTDNMGQEVGSIYNLNVGRYDVTVSTGPSYTAKRQEAAENQIQLVQSNPELMQLIGDILFKNMDWPGSDKIADRLKTLLPPEIKQMEESKEQGPADPKVQAMMAQVQQASKMLEQREAGLQEFEGKANEMAVNLKSEQQAVESAKKSLDADRKVFMAETREKQMLLDLNAIKYTREIEESQEPEKPDTTLILGREKLSVDSQQHNREMALKEYQASMDRDGEGKVVDRTGQALASIEQSILLLKESIPMLEEELQDVSNKIDAPKELTIKRNKEGEIISVNGRPALRDKSGNLIGLK